MRRQGITAAGVFWLVLAGCGGDDGGSSGAPPATDVNNNTVPTNLTAPIATFGIANAITRTT